ncbi:DUF1329 domain-containing protein [Pseudomonas fluorescens]|nr:DUF1329 domain-containing protein [Pseudomonas fluorescens]
MFIKQAIITVAATIACCAALAAVTPEEAIKLGGPELTETGAIKSGNADGSIPPYSGEKPPTAKAPASAGKFIWGDPYADEKPLFVIDSKNMDQYASKLSEGQKVLLKRYPTYRIEVFPTHREAVIPDYVAKNTPKCSTTAQLVGDNNGIIGAASCIPFPLPKNGYEAMWNAALAVEAPYEKYDYKGWLVDSSGNLNQVAGATMYHENDYWNPNVKEPRYSQRLVNANTYPPAKAGNKDLRWRPMRMDQEEPRAWAYLTGQRRVRLAPEFTYDTVATNFGGMLVFDEINTFDGKMDRFDFSNLAIKEMIVPFHTQKTHFQPAEKILLKNHPEPSSIRWELRRVLVVDAPRKAGQRHAYKRKVFYIDQDSWRFVLYDSFDDGGSIYRTAVDLPYTRPETQSVNSTSQVMFDLTKGTYGVVNHLHDGGIFALEKLPSSTLMLPDSLAGSSLR